MGFAAGGLALGFGGSLNATRSLGVKLRSQPGWRCVATKNPVRSQVTAMFVLEARKPPPDQETLRLEVSPEDSVAALKTRIATQRHGWCADQMNVILQGAFLQDPKTMAECGLKDGDFVVITGMVSRDMRRPAGEAEGPLQEMPDEMLPLFSTPVVLNELPTDQRIDRT